MTAKEFLADIIDNIALNSNQKMTCGPWYSDRFNVALDGLDGSGRYLWTVQNKIKDLFTPFIEYENSGDGRSDFTGFGNGTGSNRLFKPTGTMIKSSNTLNVGIISINDKQIYDIGMSGDTYFIDKIYNKRVAAGRKLYIDLTCKPILIYIAEELNGNLVLYAKQSKKKLCLKPL